MALSASICVHTKVHGRSIPVLLWVCAGCPFAALCSCAACIFDPEVDMGVVDAGVMGLMAVQVAGLEDVCTGQFGDPMMHMHMGAAHMMASASAGDGAELDLIALFASSLQRVDS